MLTQFGALTPARAVAVVRQIAAALDAAHGAGVTHRDVKPENILVTNNDFAYLVDFGIARAAADPDLTQSGTTVGTYNYMAPERFSSNEVTYRADIYALACVLDECLTGVPPYRGDSVERLIASHLMEPIPRPSQLRPGRVPPAFDEVIAKGMAKNPQERYLSAGDLASAAHDALTTSDQHQEAAILRQGENATLMAPVVGHKVGGGWTNYTGSAPHPQASGPYPQAPPAMRPPPQYPTGDETMARPVPMPAGSWRPTPNAPNQWTQAAPAGPTFGEPPHAQPVPQRPRNKKSCGSLPAALPRSSSSQCSSPHS